MVPLPSRKFSRPKDKKLPCPLSAHLSSENALGRGRTLILGFIRTPPTVALYSVAHFFPLGGVDKDFPFPEDETRRHFS